MSREFVERVVGAIEDVDAFGSLFRDDAELHGPMSPEPARGRDEIVEGEGQLFDAFGEISIDVRTVLSDAGTVVAEVVLSATHDGPLDLGEEPLPATGSRVEVPSVWIFELDDEGRIAVERDYFDTGSFMRHLGLG